MSACHDSRQWRASPHLELLPMDISEREGWGGVGEREGGRERENRKMLAVLASGALNSPICHCHLQVICRLGHGIPPTLANGNLNQCSDIKRLHHGAFPGTKDAAFHPARVLRAMSR